MKRSITGLTHKIFFLFILMHISLLSAALEPAHANEHAFSRQKKFLKHTIVIDPGHGGHNIGAKGIDNTLEKTVTLSLARLLAGALADEYHVILTRKDDYWLDHAGRTAAANHAKADIFLSIHTGGSFRHTAEGITIYYFKESSVDRQLSDVSKSLDTSDTGASQLPWQNLQKPHTTGSINLANLLQAHIKEITGADVKIQNAPVMILEGADMPALILEIGYLTNPVEEKKLQDKNYLSDLAKGIASGIRDFINKKPASAFIDLHE